MADLTANVPLTVTRDHYMGLVRQKRLYSAITLLVFVLLMVAGFYTANERNSGGFLNGIGSIFDFPADLVSEAWEAGWGVFAYFPEFFPSLLETINIAAVATLLGTLLGLLLSLLATRGLALWPALIPVFRRTMDIMRAIPEIVIALVLIFLLGGGPVPAMLAIAFHTAGAIGKLFSEVNENASLRPVEGLHSVGANWSQRMALGVIPQVAPNYLSYALLRLEINIRASAILGFVGAGGIGADLREAITWGQGRFDESAAIFLMLFGTIIFFDQLSTYARGKLIGPGAH